MTTTPVGRFTASEVAQLAELATILGDHDQPMTTRERREARADRLREWADKRDTKSAQAFETADRMASIIPFGQPILVGHYSGGRDRRYRDRITSNMVRGIEHARKADSMNSRADTIERQLDQSIYSDDPDAVEALEARLEQLEAEREQIKSENAAYRKAHRAELAALTAYERDQAMPHPGYRLSNLSGNIKRNRDRLEIVRKQQARREASEAAGGVNIEEQAPGYLSVTFADKPAREILDALRAAGYRWSQGSWWGRADALPEEVAR